MTSEDVLLEFVEASRLGLRPQPVGYLEMVERQAVYERARRLRAYHALHARPEWRKARAAKMRAYRKAKKWSST